jgi:chemotaxis regulatin CheY-phosphate phosphatase CheZ
VTDESFIRVPARARDEIGQLAQDLEQGLRDIRAITDDPHGTSRSSVLDQLRDVMRITEAATQRMLDETEALVDDGHAASRLLADIRRKTDGSGAEAIAAPVRDLGVLVDRSNDRAMEIMAALEYQDLATQKVQRTFDVLEEVLVRLATIQRLVDTGVDTPPPTTPAEAPPVTDPTSGQRLADELVHFSANMDA